ncbi:MAG: hypothetical protein RBT75_04830, partial [Anaerolineae bacterium]|nr:hypothetical protein [Anaerolineae bacterium]
MSGSVSAALPLILLTGGAFGLYSAARLWRWRNTQMALFSAGVFGAALLALALLFPQVRAGMLPVFGMTARGSAFLQADATALRLSAIALALGVAVALYSGAYMSQDRRFITYYPLLLLVVAGMMGMLMATDLFNLYLFCELMSI